MIRSNDSKTQWLRRISYFNSTINSSIVRKCHLGNQILFQTTFQSLNFEIVKLLKMKMKREVEQEGEDDEKGENLNLKTSKILGFHWFFNNIILFSFLKSSKKGKFFLFFIFFLFKITFHLLVLQSIWNIFSFLLILLRTIFIFFLFSKKLFLTSFYWIMNKMITTKFLNLYSTIEMFNFLFLFLSQFFSMFLFLSFLLSMKRRI